MQKSFNLPGYTTVVQLCECDSVMVRIIALVENSFGASILEWTDLMSETFPSIWLKIQDKHKSRNLVGGFYRQWSSDKKAHSSWTSVWNGGVLQTNKFGKYFIWKNQCFGRCKSVCRKMARIGLHKEECSSATYQMSGSKRALDPKHWSDLPGGSHAE